jgi:lantibiotic biosynthesis protein
MDSPESAAGFTALLATAGAPADGSQQTPVQVDMAMSVEGRLGGSLAEEAARAAELLLRLWLEGPGGHYYSEFIASLVLAPAVRQESPPRPAPRPEPAREAEASSRLHPPGSEWLFVKLYCPRNLEDDLISGSLGTFAENAVSSGLADSWFYIRYGDPETHIRLRFHGSPERLTSQLYPHVCDWAAGLMSDGICARFVLDTYEQEIERFGGPAGMAAAEEIFAADSRAAAQLVRY